MKKFKFNYSGEDGVPYVDEVLEVNLSKAEKDLLLGELVEKWNNSPEDSKIRFLKIITDEIKNGGNQHYLLQNP